MIIDKEKAKIRIAKQCSIKEVCEFDARTKLQKFGLSYTEISEIIDWLIDENFINNTRFAQFYVRDKYRFNKWGRNKIVMYLKSKHIDNNNIKLALEEINEKEYLEILSNIIKQKLNSTTKESDYYKRKVKIINNALSKGFEMDLIINIVDKLLKQND